MSNPSPRSTGSEDVASAVTPYPPELVESYRARGLWSERTVADELRATADAFPDRDAVVTPDGRLTYRQLDEQADRLACALMDLGLEAGGSVLLQVGNSVGTVVTWYGLLKAGLVPVCTLPAHREHEIGPISRKVRAVAHVVDVRAGGSFDLVAFAHRARDEHETLRHVLTIGSPTGASTSPGEWRIEDLTEGASPSQARSAVDARQAHIDPDDVAVFQLSGGTTGVPKIIPRLHAEYWYNARAYAEYLGWDETTRMYCPTPVVHNAGTVCTLHASHAVGGCAVLGSANTDDILRLVEAEQATDIMIAPFMFAAVGRPEFARATRSLRRVILSGGKIPEEIFDAIEGNGAWAGQLFGMGEGFFTVTALNSPRLARLHTIGTPLSPLDEYKVLEPTSEEEVAPGSIGELVCRGPYTLHGYYGAPDVNATAFTSDGFFRTGDLVVVQMHDGRPYLAIEGRIKDLINRGGEKVSAAEVEALLIEHPGIEEAAVVPMPDARLGERACAFVVAVDTPLTMSMVQDHLQSHGLAKFKWPERLEWVERLPRTGVGKFDKKQMSADIAAQVRQESASSDAGPEKVASA
ncbi:AMP-binding protein [Aeromicrobium sp.]|uniref:(2,3-dihydroxybenzoyl)adenylate synthase n=1 Tax=Aeromicrobium sp. TaxID=1871063 RepID=UPI0028A9DED4|nr:AMP-binding protein [Aeromicrobium sp.]